MDGYTPEFMKQYFGTVTLSPTHKLISSQYYSLKFEIKIGEYGIDDGGHIKIAWPVTASFGIPQFDKPQEENYTTALATGNAILKLSFDHNGYVRPFMPTLMVKVTDGALQSGDILTIIMGNQEKGGEGFLAQSYVENGIEFKILLDPFGTNDYVKLPDSPFVDIIPSSFEKYRILCQSEVMKNGSQWIAVIAEDKLGNVVTDHTDNVTIMCDNDEISTISFGIEDQGSKRITITNQLPTGPHRLKLKKFEVESNPFLVLQDKPQLNRYFGDLHGQTGETVGSGTIYEYMEFGKHVAQLDFISHAANAFQVTNPIWEKTQRAIKQYHEPHRYVTFLGYEWSGITTAGGDHNVYYLHDDMPIHRCSHALIEDKSDLDTDRYPVSKLYDEFKGREDVMIIPHIGGRRATLDVFDENLSPFIEISSVHGHFQWFVDEAIDANLLTGYIASSDTHSLRPGLTVPVSNIEAVKSGLTVVYANELTRESLWEAFKKRHVYATTGPRILLKVSMGDYIMGDLATVDEFKPFEIEVNGTDGILKIELFRGNELIDTYQSESENSDKVQVWWSGAKTKFRRKNLNWTGTISVNNGKIRNAKQFGFDLPHEKVTSVTPERVTFISTTSGDYDGVILDIDGNESTKITIDTPQGNLSAILGELEKPKKIELGEVEKQIEIFKMKTTYPKDIIWSVKENKLGNIPFGRTPFYVKVTQIDGEKAWSSPIFIQKK